MKRLNYPYDHAITAFLLIALLSLTPTWAVAEPVTIDYVVAYTPEVRRNFGSKELVEERLVTVFDGVNEIFANSGLEIVHRLVYAHELSIDNSGTDVFQLFDIYPYAELTTPLEQYHADTSILIVENLDQLAYANIPATPEKAQNGGSITFSRRNFSPATFAHEIGHTLGAMHDWPEDSDFKDSPAPYGNTFVGQSGSCYRTIMSGMTTCRIPGFTELPTTSCRCFASPNLIYDGVPTGDSSKANTVGLFKISAPFLARTRDGSSTTPAPSPTASQPGATPTPEPTAVPDPRSAILSLEISRKGSRTLAFGECRALTGEALSGQQISFEVKRRGRLIIQRTKARCHASGRYRQRVSFSGKFRAYIRGLDLYSKWRIIR